MTLIVFGLCITLAGCGCTMAFVGTLIRGRNSNGSGAAGLPILSIGFVYFGIYALVSGRGKLRPPRERPVDPRPDDSGGRDV